MNSQSPVDRKVKHLRHCFVGVVILVASITGCTGNNTAPENAMPSIGKATASPSFPAPVVEPSRVEGCAIPTFYQGTAPSEEIGGYDTYWDATPAGPDGRALSFKDLPDELHDHPAVVLINTWNNTLVQGYDRLGCYDFESYVVSPDPAWPAQSIVVLDAATNDVLDSFRIDASGKAVS